MPLTRNAALGGGVRANIRVGYFGSPLPRYIDRDNMLHQYARALRKMIENERSIVANSLWHDTSLRQPDFKPLLGNVTTDVLVVGAGFSGLSAALHLTERGQRVVVLDAQQPGWGASGRSGGQLVPGFKSSPSQVYDEWSADDARRLLSTGGAAPDLVFSLIDRYGIDCDAIRAGWVQAVDDSRRLPRVEKNVQMWQDLGADVTLLNAQQTEHHLGTSRYAGGMLDRRGGGVHPLKLALGLANAVKSQGGYVHGDSRVLSISGTHSSFHVTTEKGTVKAKTVAVCTNGYTDNILPALRRSVVPVVSIQVATEPLSATLRQQVLPSVPMVSDIKRLTCYYRLDADGRFVIGGRGAYSDWRTRSLFKKLRLRARQIFPQLPATLRWQYAWGGNVAMTYEQMPHLHELQPSLFAAVGYNGRGISMATVMGRIIADKICGVVDDLYDMPVWPIRPLPFYVLRKPAVSGMVWWYGLRDSLGR